jgi:hypothetical protein
MHCGKACPDVAACRVPEKPNDSIMGRYALMLYKGVPGRWIFLKHMALLLIQDTIDAT